ncbi:unnamed protein product [Calypogeia fissa]
MEDDDWDLFRDSMRWNEYRRSPESWGQWFSKYSSSEYLRFHHISLRYQISRRQGLIIRRHLNVDEWEFMMFILARIDISFKYLRLALPRCLPASELEVVFGMDQLGPVLGSGRFKTLDELSLTITFGERRNLPKLGLGQQGSAHLAAALRTGQLTDLRTLILPICDVGAIIGALHDGNVSKLEHFSVQGSNGLDNIALCQALDASFKSGCFRNLRQLGLLNGVFEGNDAWEVFIRAIKSEKLPKLRRLSLSQNGLISVSLAALVPLLLLSSFEELMMDGCWITSKQVCDMVDAIMKGPGIRLALWRLDLHDNSLNSEAVDALVYLANSDRLPRLQELDLSMNKGMGLTSFVSLKETIETGHLPGLDRLKWEKNPDVDAVAKAIAQACLEHESLTATFDIDWHLVSDLSLRTKVDEYRGKNMRLTDLKQKHKEELQDVVSLNCAKVFLCGYPLVGKTTLRRTLIKSQESKWTKLIGGRRSATSPEPRTKGIELSSLMAIEKDLQLASTTSTHQLEEKKTPMELVLWDLAGQEEFHVLHGIFLADLGFAGGRATTFILVLKSTYEGSVTDKKLCYWLKFVASSSQKFVRRHVVIVLNCFEKCKNSEETLWKGLIKHYEHMFIDLLDICLVPFIVDVRSTASVQPLKDHLFDHARWLLEMVKVPRLCLDLQEELRTFQQGENSNHRPILSWEAFEKALKLKRKGNQLSGEALKAATLYLHEMGRIIYFDEKKSARQGPEKRSVVVPDPEWFCRRVVGDLLVPKEMSDRGFSTTVSADGSIPIIRFQVFFEDQLEQGTRTEDVISMLELVGLCFKQGTDKIVIPALIQQDDYNAIDWEGKGFYWVMGRCLATEEHGRSSIPMTLFRRLQVVLAQDMDFGGRGDSHYRAGKSFSSFFVGQLLVMVQVDDNHSVPTDDRIDILVRSMIPGDATDARLAQATSLAQATCIDEIMEKLERLCVACCPGLLYDIKVIKPWTTSEKTPDMVDRKLMSLREMKSLLIQGHKYLSWQVHGNPVQLQSFLSERELNEVLGIKAVDFGVTDYPVAVEDTEDAHFWSEVSEPIQDPDISLDVFDKSENSDLSSETQEPDFASRLTALTCSDPPFLPLLEQLDDMVYEVHTPTNLEVPELEVVFFHGLQLKYGSQTYVQTWMTRDDSQLWLKTWLVQKFPEIRVLIVSYDSSAEKTPTEGLMDMYITAENLLGSLTSDTVNLGQFGRPVVLVGHCLGGLVMKELCLRAKSMLGHMNQDLLKMKQINNLISSLRGMFFYSTPHSGSNLVKLLRQYFPVEGPLVGEMGILESNSARRNSEFEQLRARHGWLAGGVSESRETSVDFLGKSIHVVPEASARPFMDFFRTDGGADHIDVCKPEKPHSSSFKLLVEFLRQIRDAEERES